MIDAFRAAGHEVVAIDYRKNRRTLGRCFDGIAAGDVFLLQRGEYFPRCIINAIPAPRVFWATELFARCRDQDRLFRSGLFDHVYVRTESCREAVLRQGWLAADQVSVLLSAFAPRPAKTPPAVKDLDVVFIGNVTPRRRDVLERLRAALGPRLTVLKAYGDEYVAAIRRAKVVVNIHADTFPDTETRVFEVLGAGGFLITERLSPENPFRDEHLVQVDGVEDLGRQALRFLQDEQARGTIAAAGCAEAHHAHTYGARALELTSQWQRWWGAEFDRPRVAGQPTAWCRAIGWVIEQTGLPLYRVLDL